MHQSQREFSNCHPKIDSSKPNHRESSGIIKKIKSLAIVTKENFLKVLKKKQHRDPQCLCDSLSKTFRPTPQK